MNHIVRIVYVGGAMWVVSKWHLNVERRKAYQVLSLMKTVHSISSSEDDTSDEENFSSVRQWCKIDSSSPAPSRFSFTGDVVTI
ncbi:hypothetical protein TNCV_4998731 [Trichonephila clavipes]|nr:hypothetical protein TNCV_4998731 [Trichonephila clavipes]